MLLHPLPPPPAPFDFSAAFIPTSASTVSALHLTKTTQYRQALRSILASHQASRTQAKSGAPSPAAAAVEVKLIQAIDDYLPCLVAVFNSCRTDELVWRGSADTAAVSSQPPFIWWPLLCIDAASLVSCSSPSSAPSPSAKPHSGPYGSRSILFELDNVLVLYSLALSNLAVLQSIAVASYEYTDRVLSDESRKTKEASLKRGVTWGRKAVAVIRWLIDNQEVFLFPGSVPQELGDSWSQEGETSRRRMLAGLLSFHQLVPTLLTLRILLSPAQSHITTSQTTIPPLPKGYPSPALLAKLFLEVSRIADEARGELEAASGRDVTTGTYGGGKLLRASLKANSSKLASRFKSFGIGGGKNRDAERERASHPSYHDRADLRDGPPLSCQSSGQKRHAFEARTRDERADGSGAGKNPRSVSIPPPPNLCCVAGRIFRYLDAIGSYSRGVAFLYLGVAAAEGSGAGGTTQEGGFNSSGGRYGEAIVWLRLARIELLGSEEAAKKSSMLPKAWEEWTGRKDAFAVLSKLLAFDRFGSKGRHKEGKEARKGGLLNAGKFGTEGSSTSPGRRDDPITGPDEHADDTQATSVTTLHPLCPRLASYHSLLLHTNLAPLLCHLVNTYAALNDTVAFQPLPSSSELQQKIPSSRAVLTFEAAGMGNNGNGNGKNAPNFNAWRPPSPEFGPKCYKIQPADRSLPKEMGLILGARDEGKDCNGGSAADAEYAGRGSYY